MDLITIVQEFLRQGLLGVIVIILAYSYRQKEKKIDQIEEEKDKLEEKMRQNLNELHESRIKEISEMNQMNLKLVEKINATVDLLIELFKKNGNGKH